MLIFVCALATMLHDQIYHEPLRPQFHFTAKAGWLNDPNGLVFFKGEYHLFFQHNPFGTQWGNMTWGHAVSRDLVHWRQIDNAIEPDGLGTIFSGSAVVDTHNSGGFGPALVCFYTAAGGTNDASEGKPFSQCLAYSLDGRTFTKYAGNPVLPHIEGENRDPKVIWHEPTQRWIMALYLAGDRYALLASSDLKTWNRLSTIELPGASECPDFFELPLDGDKRKTKWVFWGGNGRYRVGSFDGKTFMPETDAIPSNFGNTGYAAQTYFNDPKGRRVQIAWHNNANFPNSAWNQEMGLPTELSLVSSTAGPRLKLHPVRELESLRDKRISGVNGAYAVDSGLMDVALRLRVPASGLLSLFINGQEIRYDAATYELSALGKIAKVESISGKIELRVLADRASIEIFAQGGLVSMPLFVLPTGATGFRIATTGDWKVERLEVYSMKSAW